MDDGLSWLIVLYTLGFGKVGDLWVVCIILNAFYLMLQIVIKWDRSCGKYRIVW